VVIYDAGVIAMRLSAPHGAFGSRVESHRPRQWVPPDPFLLATLSLPVKEGRSATLLRVQHAALRGPAVPHTAVLGVDGFITESATDPSALPW